MKKLLFIGAALALAGCASLASKTRDIDAKGLYLDATTERTAIGAVSITAIPAGEEAFIGHYSEDTAWLSPSTKTHAFDVYLTGTNSVAAASNIVRSICRAFRVVATDQDYAHE